MTSGPGRATAARLALAAVVVVALLVPGRLLARAHEGDQALRDYRPRGAPAVASGVESPGTTWLAEAGVQATVVLPLRLVEVRPRVVSDTAEAAIRVRVCTGHEARCTTVAEAAGSRVTLRDDGPRPARLVVAVTPSRAGTVVIEGYDVTYLVGGARRTEHAGTGLRLTVPGSGTVGGQPTSGTLGEQAT